MQAVPSEFLAIDRKERANKPFCDLDLRPAKDRTRDFEDVVIEFDPERAMREASRCVHCPDPAPCMLACPAHNDIPSAMWLIEQGKFLEAAKLYHQTSSLPEICGRACRPRQLGVRGRAGAAGTRGGHLRIQARPRRPACVRHTELQALKGRLVREM